MVCRIFSKLPSFCNNWLLWLWSVTSKWREVELFSSRNPHFRHFLCQKCVKRYQKVEKYSIFLIYFRCQASPSRTEGRVLANCAISFSSNDWLCEFAARLPCPVLCCTQYYFQAPAAQNSLLMLDLLRQCLSLEIKKAIKAGSPLVLSMNCSPPFQETILFTLYYLQFTLSGISFVLHKHLEDKFVLAFALNGH